METQGTRLESLHESGEQLIKDADYHNTTAKGIRDQLEDFDRCWEEITNSVKERKAIVSTKTRTKSLRRYINLLCLLPICPYCRASNFVTDHGRVKKIAA